MKTTLLTYFLIFCIGLSYVKSQDIHFTQYQASPLLLNPAMTGLVDGKMRATFHFREQWSSSMIKPFTTIGAAIDMPFLQNKVGNDWMGAGLTIVNDRAGEGQLQRTSVLGSVAYFKQLNRNNFLSAGGQIGFTQRSLGFSNFSFNNQYDDGFNPGLPTGEPLFTESITHVEFNVGVLWLLSASDYVNYYLGASARNITQPINSFMEDESQGLPLVYNIHFGSEIQLTNRWFLYPSLLGMYSKQARQISGGALVGYELMKDRRQQAMILGGTVYRMFDAIAPIVAFEYQTFRMGLSYDINLSDFNKVSNFQGGPELVLNYQIPLPVESQMGVIFCPRF
ncbi:MAG: type IX secretion system membrane protein PorP/SprF [Chitinophagaceae bacterium]|nr:MAG: type IX secretion system membrane protein PorP/SprF [Chitinophagaceae bacterium]